jgi:hypothetical protein
LNYERGECVVEMQFGSHIYGTALPSSDLDLKAVFIPHPKEILLQQARSTSVRQNTKEDRAAKNTAEDMDFEAFTLQAFLRLCAEGQTVAVDMLFAPRDAIERTSDAWEYILKRRADLIHSGTNAFVGYCQQQAAKYGIKGSRIAAVRAAVELLTKLPAKSKLMAHWPEIAQWVSAQGAGERKNGAAEQFIRLVNCKGPNGELVDHLEVCGRKVATHNTVEYSRRMYQLVLDNYGERARKAEANQGVDWKALMHAVRVCHEALELLTTHHVTFPRPEAGLLLQIRKGELKYATVAKFIEEGVEQVKEAAGRSALPPAIDVADWEDFTVSNYRRVVRQYQ